MSFGRRTAGTEGERESQDEGEYTHPEAGHVERDVLVEAADDRDQLAIGERIERDSRVQDQLAQPHVTPGAVDKQQLLQVPELADGDVGGTRSLQAFVTRDADSDVRSLDHRDVVRTVADSEQDRLEVLLDKLDDESLLEGRDAAADNGLAHHGEFEERLRELLFEGERKTLAVCGRIVSVARLEAKRSTHR